MVVAQLRKRHFFVASLEKTFDVHATAQKLETQSLTFSDINIGVPKLGFDSGLLTSNGQLSEENVQRVNYLHDNDTDNLPNSRGLIAMAIGHSHHPFMEEFVLTSRCKPCRLIRISRPWSVRSSA